MSDGAPRGVPAALRELIVIIAGVLVALGVDNWNDDRRDRALEAQYLSALEADLRSDSVDFQRIFLRALIRKDSALTVIAPVVRGAPLEGDTLAFLDAVGLGGLLGTTSPIVLARRATYDELLASGNLSLLRTAELRSALVEHYMNVDVAMQRLRARVADSPLFVHKYSPAEMRDAKTPEAIRAFGVRRAVTAFRSPDFEALMDQEINFMHFAEGQIQMGADGTNAILRTVIVAQRGGGGR